MLASRSMSSRALAERRQRDGHHRQAVVEVLAELAPATIWPCRSRLVAAITRTSTGIASRPPTRSTVRSWRTRSSFDLEQQAACSPISSRNSVPAVGQLELALPLHVGPGERPLLVAEQLALQQRLGDGAAVDGHERGGCAGCLLWTARATSSLPVPLSPWIEDGHVGLGHQRHHAEDLAHPRRAADDLLEAGIRLGLGQLLSIVSLSSAWRIRGPSQHHLVLVQVRRLRR